MSLPSDEPEFTSTRTPWWRRRMAWLMVLLTCLIPVYFVGRWQGQDLCHQRIIEGGGYPVSEEIADEVMNQLLALDRDVPRGELVSVIGHFPFMYSPVNDAFSYKPLSKAWGPNLDEMKSYAEQVVDANGVGIDCTFKPGKDMVHLAYGIHAEYQRRGRPGAWMLSTTTDYVLLLDSWDNFIGYAKWR